MKFGADFLHYQYCNHDYEDLRGRMIFLGRFTNDPTADFVLGYAQTSRRFNSAANCSSSGARESIVVEKQIRHRSNYPWWLPVVFGGPDVCAMEIVDGRTPEAPVTRAFLA